jgi:hypothetical protein
MNELKRHWPIFRAALAAAGIACALLAIWTAHAGPMLRDAGSKQVITTVPGLLAVAAPLANSDTTMNAPPQVTATNQPSATPIMQSPEPVETETMRVLTSSRQFALGMIETGNDDRAIGGAGEVSRYQIMPAVWQHYSSVRSYRNPDSSLEVAQLHWASLYDYFKKQTRHEPTDFDMYVLWNTRYGYYSNRGFNPARLAAVVRDRAQRFSNLVEDGARREAEIATPGRRS